MESFRSFLRIHGKVLLGGGFEYFLFLPLLGEIIQFDEHIFQMGWFNHQLDYAGEVPERVGQSTCPEQQESC